MVLGEMETVPIPLDLYQQPLAGFPAAFSPRSDGYMLLPPWYVDSGAPAHATNDLKPLSQASEYGGNDSLIVGVGKWSKDLSRFVVWLCILKSATC